MMEESGERAVEPEYEITSENIIKRAKTLLAGVHFSEGNQEIQCGEMLVRAQTHRIGVHKYNEGGTLKRVEGLIGDQRVVDVMQVTPDYLGSDLMRKEPQYRVFLGGSYQGRHIEVALILWTPTEVHPEGEMGLFINEVWAQMYSESEQRAIAAQLGLC